MENMDRANTEPTAMRQAADPHKLISKCRSAQALTAEANKIQREVQTESEQIGVTDSGYRCDQMVGMRN